ncbi:Dynein heavy chain, partial [Globisporangium splendens]
MLLPKCEPGQTVYEYFVHPQTYEWKVWRPPKWDYPKDSKTLDFSNLLVPTMDSVRTLYLIENLHKQRKPVLMVGGPGTAKTSSALMFFNDLNPDHMMIKRVNFSSATTAFMFQNAVESELDKRGGKSFGPPGGKKMTVFLDDLSMPLVNAWGDQPTLEIVRMIIELSGFCFLTKDRRGDFKVCEDLQYVGAMGHPGGGRNDIPNRLKRQFFIFNLILPSLTSIDDIYGQMLAGRFDKDTYSKETLTIVGKLTRATIDLWNFMKAKLLPTPAKFHYIFNMRELSRVFQGILLTPPETFTSGGGIRVVQGKLAKMEPGQVVLLTWKHECDRVFCDKLTNHKDKEIYGNYMKELAKNHHGDEFEVFCRQQYNMVSFLCDPEEDEDGAIADAALKIYEPGGQLEDVRSRVLEFLEKYNTEFPQRSMRLVLFDDALGHLLRISRLLDMPRGSALLVGVGGSGKQSLTRLASYMSGSVIFQVVLTKTYNTNSFMEDIRTLYKSAGHQRKSTTFLFTDAEIKNEIFLELLNSILMTGEVAVLCMSPLNAKFAERARKFPGLISGPTIDWFLPWPEDALIAVSKGFIQDYPMECDATTKPALMTHMGMTSLNQFLALFMRSMDIAEKAALGSKRVANIIETMTYISYRYINRGLYERDKLTFVLLLTMKILVTDSLLAREEVILLTRGGAALDINSVRRKPFSWISNESWLNVIELAQSCKSFSNLPHEMSSNEAMWRRWYEDNEPETVMIPDYETRIAENETIGPCLKLLLVRSLRMDRTILSTKEFIRNTQQMGPRYVEPVTDTIDSIFAEMRAETPVIFLLSIGADPTESIEQLARKRKHPSPAVVSVGEGQEPVALKAINAAVVNGTWVLLQNCELGLELMEQMEEIMIKLSETMDPGFRLFLTALPNDGFPLGLLQMSAKVTNEPPQGLRAGLLRSYTVMVDQDKLERVETSQWRQLLFDLSFLHSLVIERKKFGPLGWGIPYEYSNGDLSACTIFLEKHLYNGPISWPTLQYMVAEVQYGGKITDNMDRRLFNFYTEWCLTPEACSPNFSYNPAEPIFRIPNGFAYRIPVADNIDDYRNFLHNFPEVDSPEIFGLHPNADLTYRVKEANSLLGTLGDTQPKGGGGSSGISREDVVCEKAKELLDRLPEDYIEDDYKAKINKLGGLTIPLNIFLFQEIQRLQRVISKVRSMLEQLQMAIRGEVVMTEEPSWTLDAIFDAKVPPSWLRTSVGDEFSWILPTLGLWFSSLISRDEQSRTWLNTRRPNCFWLTGFFNPQGMLTAMKQEVTRKHSKTDKWALDDVVYHTEVTQFERPEQVRTPPAEGVYIYGLFMEGATWSKQDGTIAESEPKKLFTSLPVLHINSMSKELELKSRKELYGSAGPFECPCYKRRT